MCVGDRVLLAVFFISVAAFGVGRLGFSEKRLLRVFLFEFMF